MLASLYSQASHSYSLGHMLAIPLIPNEVLGADALRMRLRRLCEKKPTGKCWVDEQTLSDYKSGGERREWLEIALLESLKKHGCQRSNYRKVKVGEVEANHVICSLYFFCVHACTFEMVDP